MYSRIARQSKFSEIAHRIDQAIVVSRVDVKNWHMCGELVTNLSACPGEREAASLPPPRGLAMAERVSRRSQEYGVYA